MEKSSDRGVASLLANSSPFLDIFAGHLNESPGMEMEEKKGIPTLSSFPGGAVQFGEGVRGDPLEGCALQDSVALSCTLRNCSFPGGKGERAAGGGRAATTHPAPREGWQQISKRTRSSPMAWEAGASAGDFGWGGREQG